MKCERPFFNAKKHGLNRLQFTMCGRMIHTISPWVYLSKNYHSDVLLSTETCDILIQT
jgi:hypothetical protein